MYSSKNDFFIHNVITCFLINYLTINFLNVKSVFQNAASNRYAFLTNFAKRHIFFDTDSTNACLSIMSCVLTHYRMWLLSPLLHLYFHPLALHLFYLLLYSCNVYVLYLSTRHIYVDFTFNVPDPVSVCATFNSYGIIPSIIHTIITIFLYIVNRNKIYILHTGSWRHVPAFTGATLVFKFPLSRPFLLHITGNLRIIGETTA